LEDLINLIKKKLDTIKEIQTLATIFNISEVQKQLAQIMTNSGYSKNKTKQELLDGLAEKIIQDNSIREEILQKEIKDISNITEQNKKKKKNLQKQLELIYQYKKSNGLELLDCEIFHKAKKILVDNNNIITLFPKFRLRTQNSDAENADLIYKEINDEKNKNKTCFLVPYNTTSYVDNKYSEKGSHWCYFIIEKQKTSQQEDKTKITCFNSFAQNKEGEPNYSKDLEAVSSALKQKFSIQDIYTNKTKVQHNSWECGFFNEYLLKLVKQNQGKAQEVIKTLDAVMLSSTKLQDRQNPTKCEFSEEGAGENTEIKIKISKHSNTEYNQSFTFQELKQLLDNKLIQACENGTIEDVKSLVENGADVNAKNVLKMTPLHFACKNGNLETVKFLFDNGADVNAKNVLKMTPLHFACKNGNLETVKFLVGKGADVNVKDNDEMTPFDYLNEENRAQVNQLLLKINEQNTDEHNTAQSNQVPIVPTPPNKKTKLQRNPFPTELKSQRQQLKPKKKPKKIEPGKTNLGDFDILKEGKEDDNIDTSPPKSIESKTADDYTKKINDKLNNLVNQLLTNKNTKSWEELEKYLKKEPNDINCYIKIIESNEDKHTTVLDLALQDKLPNDNTLNTNKQILTAFKASLKPTEVKKKSILSYITNKVKKAPLSEYFKKINENNYQSTGNYKNKNKYKPFLLIAIESANENDKDCIEQILDKVEAIKKDTFEQLCAEIEKKQNVENGNNDLNKIYATVIKKYLEQTISNKEMDEKIKYIEKEILGNTQEPMSESKKALFDNVISKLSDSGNDYKSIIKKIRETDPTIENLQSAVDCSNDAYVTAILDKKPSLIHEKLKEKTNIIEYFIKKYSEKENETLSTDFSQIDDGDDVETQRKKIDEQDSKKPLRQKRIGEILKQVFTQEYEKEENKVNEEQGDSRNEEENEEQNEQENNSTNPNPQPPITQRSLYKCFCDENKILNPPSYCDGIIQQDDRTMFIKKRDILTRLKILLDNQTLSDDQKKWLSTKITYDDDDDDGDFTINPLVHCCQYGYWDVVKFLVEKSAVLTDNNAILALCRSSTQVFKENNKNKAVNLNSLDKRYKQYKENKLEILKFLVEKGADVNAKDNDEMTPLHYACENGNLETVKFLVEKGAEIDEQAYLLAWEHGTLEMVKFLETKLNQTEEGQKITQPSSNIFTKQENESLLTKITRVPDKYHRIMENDKTNSQNTYIQWLRLKIEKIKLLRYLIEKKKVKLNDYFNIEIFGNLGERQFGEVMLFLLETLSKEIKEGVKTKGDFTDKNYNALCAHTVDEYRYTFKPLNAIIEQSNLKKKVGEPSNSEDSGLISEFISEIINNILEWHTINPNKYLFTELLQQKIDTLLTTSKDKNKLKKLLNEMLEDQFQLVEGQTEAEISDPSLTEKELDEVNPILNRVIIRDQVTKNTAAASLLFSINDRHTNSLLHPVRSFVGGETKKDNNTLNFKDLGQNTPLEQLTTKDIYLNKTNGLFYTDQQQASNNFSTISHDKIKTKQRETKIFFDKEAFKNEIKECFEELVEGKEDDLAKSFIDVIETLKYKNPVTNYGSSEMSEYGKAVCKNFLNKQNLTDKECWDTALKLEYLASFFLLSAELEQTHEYNKTQSNPIGIKVLDRPKAMPVFIMPNFRLTYGYNRPSHMLAKCCQQARDKKWQFTEDGKDIYEKKLEKYFELLFKSASRQKCGVALSIPNAFFRDFSEDNKKAAKKLFLDTLLDFVNTKVFDTQGKKVNTEYKDIGEIIVSADPAETSKNLAYVHCLKDFDILKSKEYLDNYSQITNKNVALCIAPDALQEGGQTLKSAVTSLEETVLRICPTAPLVLFSKYNKELLEFNNYKNIAETSHEIESSSVGSAEDSDEEEEGEKEDEEGESGNFLGGTTDPGLILAKTQELMLAKVLIKYLPENIGSDKKEAFKNFLKYTEAYTDQIFPDYVFEWNPNTCFRARLLNLLEQFKPNTNELNDFIGKVNNYHNKLNTSDLTQSQTSSNTTTLLDIVVQEMALLQSRSQQQPGTMPGGANNVITTEVIDILETHAPSNENQNAGLNNSGQDHSDSYSSSYPSSYPSLYVDRLQQQNQQNQQNDSPQKIEKEIKKYSQECEIKIQNDIVTDRKIELKDIVTHKPDFLTDITHGGIGAKGEIVQNADGSCIIRITETPQPDTSAHKAGIKQGTILTIKSDKTLIDAITNFRQGKNLKEQQGQNLKNVEPCLLEEKNGRLYKKTSQQRTIGS
jgi:ankyrin repeat protein